MQVVQSHELLQVIILAEKDAKIYNTDVPTSIARLAVRYCIGNGLMLNDIEHYSQKLFQMTQFKSFDLYKHEVVYYKRAIALLNTLNKEA